MALDLTLDELLSTTRSVRARLDYTRPVEPDTCRAPTVSFPHTGEHSILARTDVCQVGWAIYPRLQSRDKSPLSVRGTHSLAIANLAQL
jgi:hypothetical protein